MVQSQALKAVVLNQTATCIKLIRWIQYGSRFLTHEACNSRCTWLPNQSSSLTSSTGTAPESLALPICLGTMFSITFLNLSQDASTVTILTRFSIVALAMRTFSHWDSEPICQCRTWVKFKFEPTDSHFNASRQRHTAADLKMTVPGEAIQYTHPALSS